MDAGFEAHLHVGDATVDAADVELLAAVDRKGSLNAAADALERSYSRAQKRVSALEDAVGPLVERTRGGAGGGGSRLTADGRDLLARFARVRAAFADTAETTAAVLRGEVVARDGELATVDTGVGRVRALLFEDAATVQVTVRADAVTLHAPEDAPSPAGTSARNQFRGTVTGVDRRESVALVTVELEAGRTDGAAEGTASDDSMDDGGSGATTLPVLVTERSLSGLDLEHGTPVVATFKATATRATPA